MATKLEKILLTHPNTYITDGELDMLLRVNQNQRHGQVKRALQKGDLIHVRRGLYVIADHFSKRAPHPFELAQKIYWPSYISQESALSYHGLIPETVYTTTSVSPFRKKQIETPFGLFTYLPLPKQNFFIDVARVQEDQTIFFMANPWKALLDYVFCLKIDIDRLTPWLESMRIEKSDLPNISHKQIEQLEKFYHNERISKLIKLIKKETK
ncbi:MAG: hypothetical protein AABY34_02885 [Pseudomonadota bacterium]